MGSIGVQNSFSKKVSWINRKKIENLAKEKCKQSSRSVSCLQRQIHAVHFKTRTACIKGAKDVFNERRLRPGFYKIKTLLLKINEKMCHDAKRYQIIDDLVF